MYFSNYGNYGNPSGGGYGAYRAYGQEVPEEPPSRAVWFLAGVSTVLLWPVLSGLFSAGGNRAIRYIGR